MTRPKYVLAVSGGADSVYLLYQFRVLVVNDSINKVAVVAHFNHSPGDPSADKEQAFVKDLCENNGIRYFTDGKAATKAQIKAFGYEGAWRNLRYAWLRKLKEEVGAEYIVTGHNLDDNVETVALKLDSGVEESRASGMPILSGDIMRPMLTTERDDIRSSLKRAGIPYIDSPINNDITLRRNFLREYVLRGMTHKEKLEYVEKGNRALANLASHVAVRRICVTELVRSESFSIGMWDHDPVAVITAIQQYTASDVLPRVAAKAIKAMMADRGTRDSLGKTCHLRKDVHAYKTMTHVHIVKLPQ